MKAPLSYVPALPAALGMMAGIVLFGLSHSWLIPAFLLIIACVAFVLRHHWFAFLFAFTSIGWFISLADHPSAPPEGAFSSKAEWSGTVADLRTTQGAVRLTVELDNCNHQAIRPFSCTVLIPNPACRFEAGDVVCFDAVLFDPAVRADLPDENSYNPKYFTDGISAQANVAPDEIEIIAQLPSVRRSAIKLQSELRDIIYNSPVNSQTAWFLSATLLGDDSMLDPDVKQQFRAIGVAHYLALSGFHIGIIAMLASVAFFPLKLSRHFGRLRHIAVITLIWIYAFACGLSPSLVRAAVLISIFLLAKVLQRRSSPYNSLCVAAILILSFSPRQLFAPGFQMSFAAVLAILLFAPRFNPFKNQSSRAYRLTTFVTVPVAAMLGTCLISMVHFHRFPLLFLLPNLVLAILLPILLSAGVVMMIATAVGLHLDILGKFVDFVYLSVARLSQTLAALDGAELTGIFLPAVSVIAGAAALILLAFALSLRRRLLFILSSLCLAITVLSYIVRPSLPDAELYITRQPLRTDIVVRERDSAFIITTAPQLNHKTISSSLSRRYADFLARRACSDSLTVNNSDFSLPNICRRGDYIIFGDRTLLIATPQTVPTLSPNYLIITRLSGNTPFTLVRSANPDTVIIARDTPPKRTARLLDSCRSHSIPAIHLTDKAFSLLQ